MLDLEMSYSVFIISPYAYLLLFSVVFVHKITQLVMIHYTQGEVTVAS